MGQNQIASVICTVRLKNRRLESYLQIHPIDILCCLTICLPEALTPYSIQKLDEFLAKHNSLEPVTFQDLAYMKDVPVGV